MLYREFLPEDCPPEQASEITAPRLVYRLVRHNPPTDDDFRSQRAEKPQQHFNVPECQARGVSVFDNYRAAARSSNTRNLRGTQVCRVILGPGAGRIMKTGSPSHYTWWPFADYDILANCEMDL